MSKEKDAKAMPKAKKESKEGELSADELESVAGGFNPQPDPPGAQFSQEKLLLETKLQKGLPVGQIPGALYQKR